MLFCCPDLLDDANVAKGDREAANRKNDKSEERISVAMQNDLEAIRAAKAERKQEARQ
jgi:hypothetical protein